jgi:hypothetical protein
MRPLLVLLLVVLAAACGRPTPLCAATTCLSGCCDAAGVCRSGTDATACGLGGSQCAVCSAGSTCAAGSCGGALPFDGGSGSPDGGSGGGMDWPAWCIAHVTAVTDRSLRCGAVTPESALATSQAIIASCTATPPPGLAAGRSRFDAPAAQRCLDRVRQATCDTSLTYCPPVTVGLVPDDGSCFDELGTVITEPGTQCQSGSYCDATATCPGRCRPRFAIGQPVLSWQPCVEGAFPYEGTCAPLVAIGESCAPTPGHTAPRWCAGGDCVNGVCVARTLLAPEGSMCIAGTECAYGLRCANRRCIPIGDVGAPCDSTSNQCKDDLVCGVNRLCQRRPSLGEPCSFIPCGRGLYCEIPFGQTSGTCAALKQVGQTCSRHNACDPATTYCTIENGPPAGQCVAKGDVQAPCRFETRFSACRQGLFCTANAPMLTGVCSRPRAAGEVCSESHECDGQTCASGRCRLVSCWAR